MRKGKGKILRGDYERAWWYINITKKNLTCTFFKPLSFAGRTLEKQVSIPSNIPEMM